MTFIATTGLPGLYAMVNTEKSSVSSLQENNSDRLIF